MDQLESLSSNEIADLAGLDISIIISTFLYAISCAQVFVYWRSGFQDRRIIRYLVSERLHSWTEDAYNLALISHAGHISVVRTCFPCVFPQLFAHTVSGDRTLETIHSIMFWAYQYQLNVTNYGNPSGLTRSYWTLDYSLVVHGVITALVQVGVMSFPATSLILCNSTFQIVPSSLRHTIPIACTPSQDGS